MPEAQPSAADYAGLLTQWLLPSIERVRRSVVSFYPESPGKRPDAPHAAAAIWSLRVDKIADHLAAVEALWWIANGMALGHFPGLRVREFERRYVYMVGARTRRTLESIGEIEAMWHSRGQGIAQRIILSNERQKSPVGVVAYSPDHFLDWVASTLPVESFGRPVIRWDSMRSEMLMAQSLSDEPLVHTFLGGFFALGRHEIWVRLLDACETYGTLPGVLNAVARRAQSPAVFNPDVFLAGYVLMVEHMATAMYISEREAQDPASHTLRRQVLWGRRGRLDLTSAEARAQFLALGHVFNRLPRKDKVFPFAFDLERIIQGWIGSPDAPSDPVAEPQFARTN